MKLRPSAAPWSHSGKGRLAVDVHVGAAIAQFAAGRVVAGAYAWKAKAGVQHVIPAVQADAAVDAKLQQLDAVGRALHQVGPNLLRVPAVSMKGIAAVRLGFGADRAEHGSDVRIEPLTLEHQPIAQKEIQVTQDVVAILLARDDLDSRRGGGSTCAPSPRSCGATISGIMPG